MVRRSVPVIEDEAVVALFLSDILCEGIELAAHHRPSLAMVDVRLKGLDTAREFDTRFGIPSILLSGDPSALTGARGRGVSPLAVLNKPYTPDQLEAAPADAFAQT
jgi:hypothetical protein